MKILTVISLIIIILSSCKVSNIVIPTSEAGSLPRKDGKHYVLGVRGECEMCQKQIEDAARFSVPGVSYANWIQDFQLLLIDFDESKTNMDSVSIAIARRGYDTERHIADSKIYNALPYCCQYR